MPGLHEIKRDKAAGAEPERALGRATLLWGALVLAVLLPIGLLATYSYRIASQTVHALGEANTRTTATVTAEYVGRELQRSLNLARAFARLPGVIESVAAHDEAAVRARLEAVVESYPGIDRAFVADLDGLLWTDYPRAPESLGKNFSDRDWFRGVTAAWRPYVSEVYQRHAAPRPLVVAIAVPIADGEKLLGILVYQHRLDGLTAWLRQIRLGGSGHVFVLDHQGVVAAHPRLDLEAGPLTRYRDCAPVGEALAGQAVLRRYADPYAAVAMVATFMPVQVGGRRWVVVAQLPVAEAAAPLGVMRRQLILASSILALAAVFFAANRARISYRHQRLAEQFTRERNVLRSLIDNVPDHIYVKDPAGRYLLDNRAHMQFVGAARPAEVLGKTVRDLFPPELAERYQADDRQVLETNAPLVNREEPIVSPGGVRQWVATTKVPLRDEQGAITGLVGISRDITARKQAEEAVRRERDKAQQYLDVAGVMLVIVKADETVGLINKMGCAILGYDSEKEIVGRNWFDKFLPPAIREEVRGVFRQLISGEYKLVEHYENPVRTKGGAERLIAWHNILLHDDTGRCEGVLSSGEDITEQRAAEAQIRELNAALQERARKLEAANKELEAFSYSVSHDLRAPLRAIDGFSGILLERAAEFPTEARHHLQLVRQGAQQMGQLIDDLLRFSRLSRQPLQVERVSVATLVAHCRQELRAEQEGRAIEWRIDTLPDCQGDAALLKQVVLNLLSNALKYSRPRRPAVITVGWQADPTAAGGGVYFVADNGVGFDMRYTGKLFGVFQRLHRAEDYEGTGVGLALVQRILHRHGGRIWCEAELDKGATFYFTIGGGQA